MSFMNYLYCFGIPLAQQPTTWIDLTLHLQLAVTLPNQPNNGTWVQSYKDFTV